MALNSSGPLSFGGATAGQSINLELGVSATATASIDSAAFRGLAGVASGAISLNNFYGKSNLPTIGAAYEGGYFAGQISTSGNGIADFNLVVAPKATGQSNLKYKTSNSGGNPQSAINGPANSTTMNSSTYPAAQFCKARTIGGYTDWYMPAKNELEVLYYNLKPTTNGNNTSSGINPNSIPPRTSNYTNTVPARTSAAIFINGGSEAFTNNGGSGNSLYWSSTQQGTDYDPPFYGKYSWSAYMNVQVYGQEGKQRGYRVTYAKYVRAVRRVAV